MAEIIKGKKVTNAFRMADPENLYTNSQVSYKIPTKAEKTLYISLAALGGVAIGLIASQFIH